jgi:uncharacterized protein YcfJ
MRQTLSAVAIIGLVGCSPALADSINGTVMDHYKTVINQTPYKVEICREVNVGGDKTGDALKGAIIGGIIGNNVTKNVDNGAAVGAILGGIIGHNNSKATGGTRTQCSWETRYEETSKEVYSHSTIRFWFDGKQHTLKFVR